MSVVVIQVLFVLTALGFAIGGLIYRHLQGKKTQAWAEAQGYTYHGRTHWHDQYEHFEPFGQGGGRKSFLCVESGGRRAFEYQYTVGGGKNRRTYIVTVGVIKMQPAKADLSIKPETFGHKIFDALGGEDIDFESDEFSKRFWVKSLDRKFAYDVIHPRMMELLLEHDRHWQWRGNELMLLKQGRMQIEEVTELWGLLERFPPLLPTHV